MKILIPMAGTGARFTTAGYAVPKPLVPVRGRPMFEAALSCLPNEWPRVFICNNDHLKPTDGVYELSTAISDAFPESSVVGIPVHKGGPIKTVLAALLANPDLVDDDEPVLVHYADFGMRFDANNFVDLTRDSACDGAILCYRGFQPQYLRPQEYATCRTQGDRVLEVREKGHFTNDRSSEWTSAGSYFFRTGAIMKQAFEDVWNTGLRVAGEAYVSLAYTPMINWGMDVRVAPIDRFLQWGTPDDLEDFEYWTCVVESIATARAPEKDSSLQALIPMAGKSSRFPQDIPKPLVMIDGRPMFTKAFSALPAGGRRIAVVRRDMAESVSAMAPDVELAIVDGVTAGQAVSVMAGLDKIDPDRPVMVSNCDHAMVIDGLKWADAIAQAPDVIVVGQIGHPGAQRTPLAYAYIRMDSEHIETTGESSLRKATAISCKIPISPNPRRDPILTGTWWFRSARWLIDVTRELIDRDIRVNGELYLDSILDLCVAHGWDVRMFPANGYLDWGTPQSLAETRWWQDAAGDLPIRLK